MPPQVAFAFISAIYALHVAYFLLCLRKGPPDPGVDGEVYRQLAREYLGSATWLGENCRNVFWTPWFLFIAAVGAHPVGVFGLHSLFFVGGLWALGRAAEQLGLKGWWKLAAMGAYGLYWPTFDYIIFYQYENFLASCVIVVVWLFGRPNEQLVREQWRWAAAGLVVGLALFAHSRVAGLLVLGGILLLSSNVFYRRSFLRLHVTFWIPALAPLGLWALRNKLVLGQWVLSSTSFGYNFYVGFNPVATGSFMPQPPYPPLDRAADLALEFIANHPWRAVELIVWKLVRFWEISEAHMFGPAVFLWQERLLMPLGVVGFAVALWRSGATVLRHRCAVFDSSHDATLFATAFMIVYFQAFHALFYVFTPRFRLPAMPLVALLATYVLWEGWRNRSVSRHTPNGGVMAR